MIKSRTRKTATAAALTLLVSLTAAGSGQLWASESLVHAPQHDRVGTQTNLEGTWRATVTRKDCETGAPGPNFVALLTFGSAGTLTETTTALAPSQRTSGHGYWERTSRREFNAVSEAFLFDPTNAWTGTQRITQAITIGTSHRDATSTATFEIMDPTGNVIGGGCAAAVLTRMDGRTNTTVAAVGVGYE